MDLANQGPLVQSWVNSCVIAQERARRSVHTLSREFQQQQVRQEAWAEGL